MCVSSICRVYWVRWCLLRKKSEKKSSKSKCSVTRVKGSCCGKWNWCGNNDVEKSQQWVRTKSTLWIRSLCLPLLLSFDDVFSSSVLSFLYFARVFLHRSHSCILPSLFRNYEETAVKLILHHWLSFSPCISHLIWLIYSCEYRIKQLSLAWRTAQEWKPTDAFNRTMKRWVANQSLHLRATKKKPIEMRSTSTTIHKALQECVQFRLSANILQPTSSVLAFVFYLLVFMSVIHNRG